jgi:putative ABC transport system permease protein
MQGLPSELGPIGPDPSVGLLSVYLLSMLGMLILIALSVGLVTLPVFFAVLYAVERVARWVSETGGGFASKLVLIMFRGLRRSPLRTSLTYLALFVLTMVLALIYSFLTFMDNVTKEKEANFKAIVTHKTMIPSQMPPKHYTEFKRLVMEELPPDMRPANGELDIMSWTFVLGTTDKVNKKPDNAMFLLSTEPNKIQTMMDWPDDLTAEEKDLIAKGVAAMEANKQAIVVSDTRLKKLNVKVGQRIKLYGLNYPDMDFEFDIVGALPEGKYEGLAFMNKEYMDQLLKQKPVDYAMQDKAVNLIWVRLPTKAAFERLNALVDDGKHFSNPQIKMETASSGIGAWIESLKDILFGMKWVMSPAMVAIMCLVVANAISIGVRERRTEMAVLKVLGFHPRHVLALVLGEAVLVGLLAGAMSTFLAWLMVSNARLHMGMFGKFVVPTEALVFGPVLGVLVAVAGSIGPGLSAKNVKVAEVFAKVA